MARARPRRRTRPDPPSDTGARDPAPSTVEHGAVWDGVAAGATTAVGSHVTGWTIRESELTGVDLAGRTLEGFRCRDTRFVRCDLSGAVLDGAHLDRVELTGCRLTGAVLTGARLGDVRVTDCAADLVDLGTVRAHRLLVEDSRLRAADLTGATLADSALVRSTLDGVLLHDADLGRARLHGSDLAHARNPLALRGCTIGVEQQAAVGELLLDALDITVTDDENGPTR